MHQLMFLALEAQFVVVVAQWILGLPLFVLVAQAVPAFVLPIVVVLLLLLAAALLPAAPSLYLFFLVS